MSDLKLELWPGYITSIRQYEHDILLCTEISHKVMRLETCYDILRQCTSQHGDYQTEFKSQVLGKTVLTDYNNKTYTVDDVDFETNPLSTFDTKNGPVSYKDYYQKRYNIKIRDVKQPILISKPKMRDVRGGRNEFICLIPELCRATGMTDAMRSNFQDMRKVANHTRLNPPNRISALMKFSKRFISAEDSVSSLGRFNLRFDQKLVELKGRELGPQKIYFGDYQ